MDVPPKIEPPKNVRSATFYNLILPGAGQFYLGQRVMGVILAVTFLGCFIAVMTIFLMGFSQYMKLVLGGNILEGDRLERIAQVFHPFWLVALMAAGVLIYIVSLVALAFSKKSTKTDAP